MKKLLLAVAALATINAAHAQITITSNDMPVMGDTLRYSLGNKNFFSQVTLSQIGTNQTWDYSSALIASSQGVDNFRKPTDVDVNYSNLPSDSYGTKIADTMSFGATTAEDIYTFFKKQTSPDAFIAVGFAAKLSGFPVAVPYSDFDEWFQFPLTYSNGTTPVNSTYHLSTTLSPGNSVIMTGTRATVVDGWGTIKTPFFTTPVNCIRVRSEIMEIDSIEYFGTKYVIPRHTVDYRWMTNSDHYPALWVSTSIDATNLEKISAIRYRDMARTTGIATTSMPSIHNISVYPNPAVNGIVNLDIPAVWNNYTVEVFDIQSRCVAAYENTKVLNLQQLASGQYLVRITTGSNTGYARIIK